VGGKKKDVGPKKEKGRKKRGRLARDGAEARNGVVSSQGKGRGKLLQAEKCASLSKVTAAEKKGQAIH